MRLALITVCLAGWLLLSGGARAASVVPDLYLSTFALSPASQLTSEQARYLELLQALLEVRLGLLEQAEARLARSDGGPSVREMRAAVGLLLARAHAQRGRGEQAETLLQRFAPRLPAPLQPERERLAGMLALQGGDTTGAIALLGAATRHSEPLVPVRMELSLALLQSGQRDYAMDLLLPLAIERPEGELPRQLYERANLILGYQHLRNGQLQQARQCVERIGLNSRQYRPALLLLGWINLAQRGPEYALPAWLQLTDSAADSPLVQEARLGIATAMAQKGPSPRVIAQYEGLLEEFGRERQRLQQQLEQLSGEGTGSLPRLWGERTAMVSARLGLLQQLQQAMTTGERQVGELRPLVQRLSLLLEEFSARGAEPLWGEVSERLQRYLQRSLAATDKPQGRELATAVVTSLPAAGTVEHALDDGRAWLRREAVVQLRRHVALLDSHIEQLRYAIAHTHDLALQQQTVGR